MPRSSRLEDKYNNITSGLSATTYQEAIDELYQLSNDTFYFVNNWSASLPNISSGANNSIIGQSSIITTEASTFNNNNNFILGSDSTVSNVSGRNDSNTTNNFVVGNNASIRAGSNSIQLGTGTLLGSNKLAFQNNVIANENGLFTTFQPSVYSTSDDNSVQAHLIGIHNKFSDINLTEIKVPPSTEDGSVIFYNGTNLDTTTSLLLDQNFCSVGTIDDRGYDWCNWQIGNNGSAFTSSKKSLGTKANPLPLTDGIKIGGWGFVGDDGVTPNQGSPGYVGAEISARALGDQDGVNGGTDIRIEVTPINTKQRVSIFTTNNNADIVFPQYLDTRNDGFTSSALYVDNNGTLQYGSIISYTQENITADRSITVSELDPENKINQYFISAGVVLTPPSGFTFFSFEPNSSNYISLGVDNTFTADNLKANVYNIFRRGTDIFIYSIYPYSSSSFRVTNNNVEDISVNYNTTSWQPVSFRQVGSLVRVSNRFPFGATNTTFTTGYTGFFKTSHVIILRSASARAHLAGRIINTTSGNVEVVSDFSYIRTSNQTNLYAMQSPLITIPCTTGDNFQLQLRREGSASGSVTLDSTYASQLFVESTIL